MKFPDIAGGNVKWFSVLEKTVWQFVKTLSVLLASLLLDIYPKELKTCPHKNLYTHIHSNVIYNSQKREIPNAHQPRN